ncbi:hypothetical protein EXN66_Car017486 [Channa argus]|uniref:Uncharacterized protein n=1 Tax=Channa argus TaxID=215402 RepID=A0A6G1QHS8_CHAAH|nr:hypothetical protein EXN66_Car017486 [Channa argus]
MPPRAKVIISKYIFNALYTSLKKSRWSVRGDIRTAERYIAAMKTQACSCSETLDRHFLANRKLLPVGKQLKDATHGLL